MFMFEGELGQVIEKGDLASVQRLCGDEDVLSYFLSKTNEVTYEDSLCLAAAYGHLDVLRFLKEQVGVVFKRFSFADKMMADAIAGAGYCDPYVPSSSAGGKVSVVKFLHEECEIPLLKGGDFLFCDFRHVSDDLPGHTGRLIATHGHLDVLKYVCSRLRESGHEKLIGDLSIGVETSAYYGHEDVVLFIIELSPESERVANKSVLNFIRRTNAPFLQKIQKTYGVKFTQTDLRLMIYHATLRQDKELLMFAEQNGARLVLDYDGVDSLPNMLTTHAAFLNVARFSEAQRVLVREQIREHSVKKEELTPEKTMERFFNLKELAKEYKKSKKTRALRNLDPDRLVCVADNFYEQRYFDEVSACNLELLQFLYDHRGLDLNRFYEFDPDNFSSVCDGSIPRRTSKMTLFMAAAENGNIGGVEFCIRRLADPTLMNEDGKTAADMARDFKYEDMADILVAYESKFRMMQNKMRGSERDSI